MMDNPAPHSSHPAAASAPKTATAAPQLSKPVTDVVEESAKHDTISPAERTQRHDSLEKHLQQRPDAQELKDRNILRDTNAAP